MPAESYWIEPPHIMGAKYAGKITAEDVSNVMEACLPLVEERPMYFVVDFTHAWLFDVSLIRHTSLVKLVRHPNTACFAMVGLNRMMSTGVQLLRLRTMKTFDDADAAVAYLRVQVARNEQQGSV